ncbi:hypothetical protein QUF55_04330, partial [Clostridiaceae bacterium HSG29]|nr:hypothetical protein [Clostridiaceae bacterium HSG29]
SIREEVEKWSGKKYKLQNIFNRILKLLIEYSDRFISKRLLTELKDFKSQAQDEYKNKNELKKVFLSYAFEDYLYTIALFIFFKRNKIFLYIDWMHNDSLANGIDLKDSLNAVLEKSEQLLFLRSINSELNISGSQYIRPWCSWETGNFYGTDLSNKSEKFFLNLYGKLPHDNVQLHGFALLTGISSKGLDGITNW